MTKDLKKEYLADLDHYDEGMGIHSTSYKNCKERLIRLAIIDSAEPSEALKCLEALEQDIKNRIILAEDRQLKLCEVIKQALLKIQKEGF